MYVILCENYKEATIMFNIFVDALLQDDPYCVLDRSDYNNYVLTDAGLSYIFIDYRYRFLFEHKGNEFFDIHDFLEGLFSHPLDDGEFR